MATAISDVGGGRLLTFLYDPEWVVMFDNPVIGWVLDEAGVAAPKPVVLGTLPPEAGDTAPVLSPQWAQFVDNGIYVPDVLRTSPTGLFEFLATNHGAQRKLWAEFTNPQLVMAWRQWADGHPALALTSHPVAPG